MFGYIKPCQPELLVKELDAYKAVYCGLCRQLGKSYGPLARLTLSYDFTFLAMLAYSVGRGRADVKMGRCCVNPLKRVPMCVGDDVLRLGADAAAIMLYYKLRDNILDSGFAKRTCWRALLPVAGPARKRASAALPDWEAVIAQGMAEQRELELRGETGVDQASEPTARMLAHIFRSLTDDAVQQRVLERLGYLLGRFVYLCDALDDLEQDVREGGYNPYALRHGLSRDGGDWAQARREAELSLNGTIGEAEKTLALLRMGDFAPIIDNIVSKGLRASVDGILSPKEK